MKSKIVWILLLFFAWQSSFAAKKINREYWSKAKDGLHYKKSSTGEADDKWSDWSKDYEERKAIGKRSGKTIEHDYLDGKSEDSKEEKDSTEESEMGEIPQFYIYLAIGIVLAVLIFVIYNLFFKDPVRMDKKVVTEDHEEIQVEKPFSELDELLRLSIENGNYREAVRIYFIYIIKTLREKNWINWEKKKTNTAYLFEMRDKRQFNSFSQVVLIFEIIWYGKREITKEQYEMIRPQFDQLLNSLKSTNE